MKWFLSMAEDGVKLATDLCQFEIHIESGGYFILITYGDCLGLNKK